MCVGTHICETCANTSGKRQTMPLRVKSVLGNCVFGSKNPNFRLARPNHGGPRSVRAASRRAEGPLSLTQGQFRFLSDPVPDLRITPGSTLTDTDTVSLTPCR